MSGIIRPPGVTGPFQDCPRLYFTDKWLSKPPSWCEVGLPPEEDAHAWLSTMSEWDTSHYHALMHRAYDMIRRGDTVIDSWFLFPKGTKITHEFPLHRKVIWVLTGLYWPLTQSTVYEGRWPD